MFDASKRKNDDKRKPLSRRHVMLRVGLFISLIVLLLWIAVRFLSYRDPQRPTGQIFYTRDNEPMVINLQTGERAPYEPTPYATSTPAPEQDPLISPDGKWRIDWQGMNLDAPILYAKFYLIPLNPDTNDIESIGPIYAEYFIWSPDNQSMIFKGFALPLTDDIASEYQTGLWRVDLPSHQLIYLTNLAPSGPIVSSPDSTKIAYTAIDGYTRLYVTDLKTGKSIQPISDLSRSTFAWSPDSQWILYETNVGNLSDIWIVRADGTTAQGISLEPLISERNAIWKP